MTKQMKRIFATLAFALVALFAVAQNNIPVGMRMEMTEIGEDDEQYSIFTYKDEDGTYGYYLSLGHEYRLLEISRDDVTDFTFSHFEETCLWMGSTADEAAAFLESLLALVAEEPGTMAEFPCRLSSGAEKLAGSSTATCMVVKRFLQRKRLCFHFISGGRTAETDLTQSAMKSLRWSFNLARKLHPDQ
jgi:hypothetical protein